MNLLYQWWYQGNILSIREENLVKGYLLNSKGSPEKQKQTTHTHRKIERERKRLF